MQSRESQKYRNQLHKTSATDSSNNQHQNQKQHAAAALEKTFLFSWRLPFVVGLLLLCCMWPLSAPRRLECFDRVSHNVGLYALLRHANLPAHLVEEHKCGETKVLQCKPRAPAEKSAKRSRQQLALSLLASLMECALSSNGGDSVPRDAKAAAASVSQSMRLRWSLSLSKKNYYNGNMSIIEVMEAPPTDSPKTCCTPCAPTVPPVIPLTQVNTMNPTVS